MKNVFGVLVAGLVAAALMAGPSPATARDPQKLVDDAAALATSLLADSEWADFHRLFETAQAVVLVPDFLKAGFLIGAAGGQCVIVARHAAKGEWGAPAFCLIGEASLGFQAGAQKSEFMMLVMSRGALETIASGTAELGGEAGLAVGLIGAGVKGSTTLNLDRDLYAFARSQGLYGGVALEGGWIGPDSEYNRAYYGRPVTARGILLEGKASHPGADRLRAALARGVVARGD